MERKTIRISKNRYEKKYNDMISFLWKEENKVSKGNEYVVSFIRDISKEDALLLDKQEKKVMLMGVMPFIIQAVLCLGAVSLLTVFLVTMKKDDILIPFLSLVLPAVILLGLAVLTHIIYTKTIFNKMDREAKKTHELIEKIKERN